MRHVSIHRSVSPVTVSSGKQIAQRRWKERLSTAAAVGGAPLAVGIGAALVGLGAFYIVSDPQKRRELQMEETGGSEKESVREYFDGDGFDRWKRIYGTTTDINNVQKDIRDGHAITIEKTLNWIINDSQGLTASVCYNLTSSLSEGNVAGATVCDAGCGTGSLAIPLSLEGAEVSASDISQAMVNEAEEQFATASKGTSTAATPKFEAKDLESLEGNYDIVTCLDVMIHYPQGKVDEMIAHLASLSRKRLIISFAPKTPYYSFLKRIGEFFPGPSKATRAYLHSEADVEAALNKAGFKIQNREMTATSFYFSRLFDAVRF